MPFFPFSIRPLDDSPSSSSRTPPSKGGASDALRQAPVQRRRFAKVHTYSTMEVVSTFGGVAVGGDNVPPTIKEEEDQKLPPLYEAFQLTLEVHASVCSGILYIEISDFIFKIQECDSGKLGSPTVCVLSLCMDCVQVIFRA